MPAGLLNDGARGCWGGEAAQRRGEGEGEGRRCSVRARVGKAARRRDGGVVERQREGREGEVPGQAARMTRWARRREEEERVLMRDG